MNLFNFFMIYEKNLANPLRNAFEIAYCTSDPWCTRDRSNTVVLTENAASAEKVFGKEKKKKKKKGKKRKEKRIR